MGVEGEFGGVCVAEAGEFADLWSVDISLCVDGGKREMVFASMGPGDAVSGSPAGLRSTIREMPWYFFARFSVVGAAAARAARAVVRM